MGGCGAGRGSALPLGLEIGGSQVERKQIHPSFDPGGAGRGWSREMLHQLGQKPGDPGSDRRPHEHIVVRTGPNTKDRDCAHVMILISPKQSQKTRDRSPYLTFKRKRATRALFASWADILAFHAVDHVSLAQW